MKCTHFYKIVAIGVIMRITYIILLGEHTAYKKFWYISWNVRVTDVTILYQNTVFDLVYKN